ncbi:MAG: alkaline phosphatase D family protein [Gemmataceae bacterium]|nr:alkaline phosphatase D family protein [Gemmataceae bacterium]
MPRYPRIVLVLLAALSALPVSARAGEPGKPLSRIAFGSCAHQDRPQPIWDKVLAVRPDLFLFVGDNIYGDTKDMAVLKAKYDKLGAVPGYQKLLKACRVLATWDDHDYGWDDAGSDYPRRVESQQIFLDFFGVARDSPRRQQEGVYHAEVYGPPDKRVQVILLDTRYHRSPLKKQKVPRGTGPYVPNPDRKATMLGEAQWKWLEQQLRVPAKLRLLASSIQVVPEDHGWEKWTNLPHERERLYKLIRDTKAGGVVVLSGDRHLAELSVMDAGIGYPLYDLTSSGLNQGYVKGWRAQEVNRHRVATMNMGHNLGLVAIDWGRPDPVVSLQIRDEAGDVTIQQKVPLSVLQPGALKSKGSQRARLATGELLTKDVIAKHLDKRCTVELQVAATGASTTLMFLNSASDRQSEDNFTVVLDKSAQAKLKEAGITAPLTHYEGKTIRVTGVLSLFRERPQIIVSDPAQIEILKK